MSRTATRVDGPSRGTFVPLARPEAADFNSGLLAALAVCVAFWVMAGLTVFWLI